MSSYIVVLGAPVINEQAGPWLKSRLAKTCELYNQLHQNNKIIIVSGKGMHETANIKPESKVMYNELKTKLPSAVIIEENESKNTYENAIYVLRLLKEFEIDIDTDEIYIVTSEFHIERVKILFTRMPEIVNIMKKIPTIHFVGAHTDNLDSTTIDHEKKAIEYLNNKIQMHQC